MTHTRRNLKLNTFDLAGYHFLNQRAGHFHALDLIMSFFAQDALELPKGTFTQVIPHPVDASFPSDHTAGSFGFAAGSWSKAQSGVSRGFTVLAILVAIARVYVGVH
jgi:undecaprenyl-diphosphatase